jgi:hypothetical protein
MRHAKIVSKIKQSALINVAIFVDSPYPLVA